MSDKFREGVTFAIMAAELREAHVAIAGIWKVWFAWTVMDIADVSDFEEAMAQAISCLPPSFRTDEMPAAIPYRGQVFEPAEAPAAEVVKKLRRRRAEIVDAKVIAVPSEEPLRGAYTKEMTEEFTRQQWEGRPGDDFADVLG